MVIFLFKKNGGGGGGEGAGHLMFCELGFLGVYNAAVYSFLAPPSHVFFPVSCMQLGGLQYERDVRQLSGTLASLTQWSVRDKLARLVQIGILLHLDKVLLCLEETEGTAQIKGGGSSHFKLFLYFLTHFHDVYLFCV